MGRRARLREAGNEFAGNVSRGYRSSGWPARSPIRYHCPMSFRSLALVLVAASLHAQTVKSASCDRACLEGFVNQYLDAMVARNPFSLPLAPQVKFTENEQAIPLGEGIWGTASGLGTYKLYVADPPAGEVGFLGTLRE